MSDRIAVSGQTPVLSGPEITDQLKGGTESRYTWVGSRSECEAQRAICRAGNATTVVLRPMGDGNWELSATYPNSPEEDGGAGADEPTNQHELEITAETVPVWQSPVLIGTHDTPGFFGRDEILAMQMVWKLYEDGQYASMDTPYVAGLVTNYPDYIVGWSTMLPTERALTDVKGRLLDIAGDWLGAQEFFNSVLFKGTDKVYRYQYSYRRTITAANWVQVQVGFEGVGKIWTSAEVVAAEGVPTAEWFGLPVTQWLKQPPRVSAAAGGKTAIEYSYQGGFDAASHFLYQAHGTAALI